ncbi:hypothetical protein A2U01_0048422, partial [Trifolium medium]|nr:hypothetical protein [Trifolium medium]
ARVMILARRDDASPGEMVAVPRHFSPAALKLSGPVSLELAKRRPGNRA